MTLVEPTTATLRQTGRPSHRAAPARGWRWARFLVAPVILGVLVWRLGAGPFLDGLRKIDSRSLAAAGGIALATTVCSAWRWRLVAHGLGLKVAVAPAIAAYYRSQFLNSTLPGGVLGDVHRGVLHGRSEGDVGRGLRAVGWERSAGQVVQLTLAVIVLLVLPSPVPSWVPVLAAAGLAFAVLAALLIMARSRPGPSRTARILATAATDIRFGLFARRSWPGIVLASAVVVAGHTATFLLAARTAGSSAPPSQMLPLALLVLLAAAVPTNIGGWGPREGVAAWAFAAAGLGAEQGVTAAVVFGVMTVVATLPGALVLLAGWLFRTPWSPQKPGPPTELRLPGGHAADVGNQQVTANG